MLHSLKLHITEDLITITTVYLLMIIIRTTAEIIGVLFPGMNLPSCAEQLCKCVCVCVCVHVRQYPRESKKVRK